jgi:hypothetical protein
MRRVNGEFFSRSTGFQPVPSWLTGRTSARVGNPCYRILMLLLLAALMTGASSAPMTHFRTVNIYIDPHNNPLAAYQLEFTGESENVKLVGIEGGEHPAFKDPPYYDPKAMMQNRVILAALNAGDDLPATRTRVARLHLEITGEHDRFRTRLIVAAASDGSHIAADVSTEEGAKP